MEIFNWFLLFGRQIELIYITYCILYQPQVMALIQECVFLTALCGEIRTLSLTVAHRRTEPVYKAFWDGENHDNIILSSGISNLWQVAFFFWSATPNCFLVDLWTLKLRVNIWLKPDLFSLSFLDSFEGKIFSVCDSLWNMDFWYTLYWIYFFILFHANF